MKKLLTVAFLGLMPSLVAFNLSLSQGVTVDDPEFAEWNSISLSAVCMDLDPVLLDKSHFSLSTERDSPFFEDTKILAENIKAMVLTEKSRRAMNDLKSPWSRIDWTYTFDTSFSNYGSSVGSFAHGSTQLSPDLHTHFGFGVRQVNGRKGYSDGQLYQLEGGLHWLISPSASLHLNFVTDYYDRKN